MGPIPTYTTADAEVDPPRMTRQQLPRQPEPGDDTGYFDVIVNEPGTSSSVQLISPDAPVPGAHADGRGQGVEVQAGAAGRAAGSLPDADRASDPEVRS